MIILLVSALLASVAAAAPEPALPSAGLPPPPALRDLPAGEEGALIRYGLDLVANTADWIGPRGKLKHLSKSRMACRNCHLDSGMRPFGNSWLDTFQLYPQYRAREGGVQSLADRINTCLEHPLQGKPLPVDGREMKAMLMYFRWIGRGRTVLWNDPDNRLAGIRFLDRPANPKAGEKIFSDRCSQCHGPDGQGKLRPDGAAFIFPPLWGKESFMQGASMSRISVLARFVKTNMPLGATADQPFISEEEAWDVAAFVDSQNRPGWSSKPPYVVVDEKPFDYPIGPYGDAFPVSQHLFGPFTPIIDFWKSRSKPEVAAPTGI
jgi:thiosulfate dehydrogenase